MVLKTHDDAIVEAKSTLQIPETEFGQLSEAGTADLISLIEDEFVDGHGWNWWWEHLLRLDYAVKHLSDNGYIWLHELLPNLEESVYFVVEPSGNRKSFSVYKALAKYIQPVLAESICFEYSIVAEDLSWLIIENHHGVFCFVGEPVTSRIKRIVEASPGEWHATISD